MRLRAKGVNEELKLSTVKQCFDLSIGSYREMYFGEAFYFVKHAD